MTPEEPLPDETRLHPQPPAGMEGLDPAELLARGLNTVQPSAGASAWLPPSPEELARLLPQYNIESLLGHGGMGAVYKGRQATLERTVAIKLLPAELAADAQFIARFQREARTLAQLQHPGIVSVYDFGQTSEGHLYFVMEFVDGTDLHRLLRGPGLPPQQALKLISQVCDALHYAHGKGVIHRDIKPGNILVNSEGWVKLADFGLARPIKGENTALTGTHVVVGTTDYMAPEQQQGHADQRADIYALGVMLYEMLTGQRPQGIFDPPSHRVQVDVRLDDVVLKALQQEPERRYQQVSEMKTDVDHIRHTPPPPQAAGHAAASQPPVSGAEPRPVPPAGRAPAASWPRRTTTPPHQPAAIPANAGHPSAEAILQTTTSMNRTMLILGSIALLLIGGLAIYLATRKNGDTYNTVQNLTYQEIQNNYFTTLITSGATTEKDLAAITDIRPHGSLFIGVSKEPMTIAQAQDLAKRTGAGILRIEDSPFGSSGELTAWLGTSYASHLGTPVWVQQSGENRILDGGTVRPVANEDQTGKVFLQWQGPDSLRLLAEKDRNARLVDSSAAVFRTATKEHPFINTLGMEFVPVPGTQVLFCRWETRVKDYTAYAKVNTKVDGAWTSQQRDGVPVGREPDHPVCAVSWEDASAFCAWLTKKESTEGKLSAGMTYRLPTDEEWSKAVGLGFDPGPTPKDRAGKNIVDFPWGTDFPPKAKVGNYADTAWHEKFPNEKWIEGYDDGYATTAPVGSFAPNEYGIYDLGGNVSEWCEDLFEFVTTEHALRGAAWEHAGRGSILSSGRGKRIVGSNDRMNSLGFRCVLGPASSAQPAAATAQTAGGTFATATKDAPFINGLGMKFVPVPILGGPTDQQRVLFSVWETRVQDYEEFVKDKAVSWPKPPFPQGPTHSVVNVMWDEAQEFCVWLTERERKSGRLGAAERYRLPTDHEWSCAVGIGEQESPAQTPIEKSGKLPDVFPWGKTWPPPSGSGNYGGEEVIGHEVNKGRTALAGYRDEFPTTAPVGSFAMNRFGLYDISGNAAEWCEDLFGVRSTDHVLRGASWSVNDRPSLLSSMRHRYSPSPRLYNCGFRCVVSASAR